MQADSGRQLDAGQGSQLQQGTYTPLSEFVANPILVDQYWGRLADGYVAVAHKCSLFPVIGPHLTTQLGVTPGLHRPQVLKDLLFVPLPAGSNAALIDRVTGAVQRELARAGVGVSRQLFSSGMAEGIESASRPLGLPVGPQYHLGPHGAHESMSVGMQIAGPSLEPRASQDASLGDLGCRPNLSPSEGQSATT